MLEEISEEADRFLVERPADRGELGEDLLALFIELVEVAGVQPLRTEFHGKAADAGIGNHAASLGGEGVGFGELARCGAI